MAERDREEDAPPRGTASLREQLHRLAEALVVEQQERVAAAAGAVAHGLRHAAGRLEPEHQQLVGRYAEDAAAQIERFSETVRRQRLSEVLAQAEGFARRRPGLFLAGAVAGGFVLGRVLSAPASRAGAGAKPSKPSADASVAAHDIAQAMEEV